MDLDTTAKGAKIDKVLFLPSSLEDTRGVLLSRSKGIGNTKMVEEGVLPEFDIKSSAFKESTDMITNGLVGAFDWSILMRRVYSYRMDFIVLVGKDALDVRIGLVASWKRKSVQEVEYHFNRKFCLCLTLQQSISFRSVAFLLHLLL